MARKKTCYAMSNGVGGFDLMTERDAGNEIRILTGSEKFSLKFWENLKNVAEAAIDTIESGETNEVDYIEPYDPKIKTDREDRKKTKQGIFNHENA